MLVPARKIPTLWVRMMAKKITGLLAVLMFTAWAGMATAATVTVTISGFGDGSNDGVYLIDTVSCRFLSCTPDLKTQQWWGNFDLAGKLAAEVAFSLGNVNPRFGGQGGPYFAYERNAGGASTNVRGWGDAFGTAQVINTVNGDSFSFSYAHGTFTPAVIPIPAAAWLFGSALLGLGVVKRKTA